jgi:hypothetical protein
MSLNYYDYYRLADPLASQPIRLTLRGYDEEITSVKAMEIFTAESRLNRPLRLGAYQGKRLADFLWSAMTPIVCISERVADMLTRENITGWSTYETELFDGRGNLIHGYQGLSVTGAICRRNKALSRLLRRPPVTASGEPFTVYKGLYFHETDWEGSDFFLIQNHGMVVVKKVKDLLSSNAVFNVELIPLPEVEIDTLLDKFE